ncbi:hypothetical protein [Parahaliea aestuarii]|uniref:Uncharacterized protein n=1 Tax=Parahaliea aestuarii TaxID=1852021 RepID=A0A5C8ZMU6_9GAMM|nr:hypothetical protein [Parahaliea aestuarii]TXS88959.1 hypothetical protein FVW59_19185 [Parahaliea aestuarii]
MTFRILPVLLLLLTAGVQAKPELIDCDPKDAARNAAMKATVGVHGPCDAGKMADRAKDDLGDKADDVRDDAGDKMDDMKDRHEKRDKKLRKDDE